MLYFAEPAQLAKGRLITTAPGPIPDPVAPTTTEYSLPCDLNDDAHMLTGEQIDSRVPAM
jgi:hypothetical protein